MLSFEDPHILVSVVEKNLYLKFLVKMSVYHDEVEIEDFEYDSDSEIYFYPCPCGDRFEITKVM